VDIESRSTGLLEKLDQLRRHSLFPPFLTPWLLVRADNYDTRLFCKAAGPFHVLERQLNAAALQHSLLDARPRRVPKDWFSRNEWPILQELSGARHYVRLPLCRIVPIAALSIVSAASS
jgi:fimbrial protein FimY